MIRRCARAASSSPGNGLRMHHCARRALLALACGFGLSCFFGSTANAQAERARHVSSPPAQRAAPGGVIGTGSAQASSETRVAAFRANYDLHGVLVAAEACRDAALAAQRLDRALRCNARVRAAAYSLGDARGLMRWAHWQARYAVSEFNHGLGIAFSQANLPRLASEVPPLQVRIDGDATLRYLQPISTKTHQVAWQTIIGDVSRGRPVVSVEIDGRPTSALLDTGTPFALLLDQAQAYALGARPLVIGIASPGTARGAPPTPGTAAFDLVRTFKLGTLVMHNLLAVVVANGSPLHGVIVGLPVLANYRQVTFGQSSVRLATRTHACATRALPETVESTASSDVPVFTARVNGGTTNAIFDTGSNVALVVLAGRFASPASAASAPAEGGTSGAFSGPLAATLGELRLTAPKVHAVAALPGDVGLDAGATVLATASVQLDFPGNAPPSICFAPHAMAMR